MQQSESANSLGDKFKSKLSISVTRYRITQASQEGGVTRTSGYGWHPGRFFFFGFLAFIAVIGTIAALSWVFRPMAVAYYPYGFGFFPFGFFFAFFWIFAIFWFIRWIFWPRRWGYWGGWGYYGRRYWRNGDSAYYILRERYARGEITKEQFDQMMRDLGQHEQSAQA